MEARSRCWIHEDCLMDVELARACGPNVIDMPMMDKTEDDVGAAGWGDGRGAGVGDGYGDSFNGFDGDGRGDGDGAGVSGGDGDGGGDGGDD